jgi:hypothetical protein
VVAAGVIGAAVWVGRSAWPLAGVAAAPPVPPVPRVPAPAVPEGSRSLIVLPDVPQAARPAVASTDRGAFGA